ncbi:MAG: hypothetical protein K0B14_09415 [Anaerolineaceae bacterium]|nr:hypothetical protein [Anaerolineaceae bacterium]
MQDQPPVSEVVQEAPDDGQTLVESITEIYVEYSKVSESISIETIPAVSPDAERPYWEILPDHQVLTLKGYPISDHLMKAQIFVYPVADLGVFNTGAATIASDLKSLLEDHQINDYLPFLPMFNAAQVMHSQVKYLDFQNGSGVRFLTQFDQAPLPIINMELIYTYQGLSSDGKYYVAAVFPVNHADLPDTNQVTAQQQSDLEKFPTYLAETLAWLGQQPDASFNPDLSKLDALVQSIVVK